MWFLKWPQYMEGFDSRQYAVWLPCPLSVDAKICIRHCVKLYLWYKLKAAKIFPKKISHAVTTIKKFTTFAVSKRFLLGHRLCENNREYGVNPWQCLLLWVPSRGALPIVEKTDKSREMYLRNSLPLALWRWEGFVSGTSQKTYLLLFTGFVTAGLRDKSKLIFPLNIRLCSPRE